MWTVAEVEGRLIAAFNRLPSHPIYTDGPHLRPLGDSAGVLAPLGWARAYVADHQAALALMTWARCRASRDSVRERYLELGWKRSTAERARRRALACIVAALNGP